MGCSFCHSIATTQEHVIPGWLQAHFDLRNEPVTLWNGTSLPYRQAKIPACGPCNNERFGRLEKKIQEGSANPQEHYLWALKIRYGLALRDSTLKLDRRSPDSGPLLPRDMATFKSEFILHAFKYFDHPDFKVRPFPFGSVFRFKLSGLRALIDVPPSYWALAITVPRGELLVVLFADRGVVKRVAKTYLKLDADLDQYPPGPPGLLIQWLVFTVLRIQNHLIIPDHVQRSERGLLSASIPTKRIKVRPQRREWYREIAFHCGLSAGIADDAFDRDLPMFGQGWADLR